MLSTTEKNIGKFHKASENSFVLIENALEGNSTSNFSLKTAVNKYGPTGVITIADKAELVFSEPIEALTICVCLVGILANSVSIAAVFKMKKSLTTHLKLVIGLCMSDALVLLANLAFYVAYIFSDWQHCTKVALRLTGDTAILATLLNLFVMALDHYAAIIQPLRYRQKMTRIKGNCAVLIVWFISLFGGLTEVFSAIGQDGSICMTITGGNFHFEMFIIGFIFFVLTATCLLYGRIYCRIRKVIPRRERASHHSDSGSVKALMTTALFVGTFILLWTPFALFSIYTYMDNSYDVHDLDKVALIIDILYLFLLMNACVDPIIYAVRLPSVKRGFSSLFTSSTRSSAC